MIDLHTHTTASDGKLTPDALMREAWVAGVRVLGVTDHDTTAALERARALAADFGIRLVPGIEITASQGSRDVHVLGYFVDDRDLALQRFLARQRDGRIDRVREIGARLAALGRPIDVDALVRSVSREGQSIGRPAIAAAMVAAGHVASSREAFDRYLAAGRPASVPRGGPTVPLVVDAIHGAGGVASLAHPALNHLDARIEEWAEAGLDALEVYHSDHAPEDVARYQALAGTLRLAVTGGSDFHGDTRAQRARLGSAALPEPEFDRLVARHHALIEHRPPIAIVNRQHRQFSL